MSDSESDGFVMDGGGSESDGYVQPSKAKKAAAEKKAPAKKAAVPKAAKVSLVPYHSWRKRKEADVRWLPQAPAAKKATTKKTPLASKNLPNDSISEAESDFVDSPVKSKAKAVDDDEDDFGAGPSIAAPINKKSASEVYQKVSFGIHAVFGHQAYCNDSYLNENMF